MTPTLGSFVLRASSRRLPRHLLLPPACAFHFTSAYFSSPARTTTSLAPPVDEPPPAVRLPRRLLRPREQTPPLLELRGGFHHLRGVHAPPPLHLHPRPRLEHGRIRRLHRRPRRERLRRGVDRPPPLRRVLRSHSGAARGCSADAPSKPRARRPRRPPPPRPRPRLGTDTWGTPPRADLRRPASNRTRASATPLTRRQIDPTAATWRRRWDRRGGAREERARRGLATVAFLEECP